MLIRTKSFELAVNISGNKNSNKLALVLPGRLDTKDYPHMKGHQNCLAEKGFLAVSFDPPGTWESPGDISLYTMTNYLKAVDEIIEYFENKPTLVMGHSRGGSMAVFAGIKNAKIKMIVDIFGQYAFTPEINGGYPNKKWQSSGYRLHKRELPDNTKEFREFRLPYTFLEDQIRYDAGEELKNCLKPKLFFYGKNDITVNPEFVKTAYKISADPKELIEIDSDHDYRFKPKLIQEINQKIGIFLDKYKKLW
jgi:hypothetical protein